MGGGERGERPIVVSLLLLTVAACSVDPGQNFQVAEVVFSESYFYCQVEPMLFERRCGPGDPALGDATGGCHFSVTAFRLSDYEPRVADGCSGNVPGDGPPAAARSNYGAAQLFMDRDPERAPLLNRPSSTIAHPRQVIEENSADAELIREWATRFSSQ